MASNWKLANRVWHANLGMLSAITLGIVALSCPVIAHKWEAGKFLEQIHYGKFLPAQTRWLWIDGQGFLLGFLIISGLLMHRKSVKKAANTAADDPAVAGSSVTLLHLGGDEAGALALAQRAEGCGLRAFRAQADAVEKLDLTQERWLILTHGGAAEPEKLAQLTQNAQAVKKGGLKRLEYTLQPGLECAELENALRAAGAKRLPAAAQGWEAALLKHLIASSPTLKAKTHALNPTVAAQVQPA
jgi:hypothetical protein